jgi:replicative DNA helicase
VIETGELERQVLNALRQDPQYIAADQRLYRGAFTHADNRSIYDALVTMHLQGSWSEGLVDEVLLSNASGVSLAKLQEVFSGCYRPPSAGTFREWVGLLLSRVKSKRAFEILQEEANEMVSGSGELNPLRLKQAHDQLVEAVEMGQPSENVAIKFVSDGKDDLYADLVNRKSSELRGIDLKSQPRLTKATSGLHGIVGLCGRPKRGKSTWAVQVAGDAADAGYNVIYMDFETGLQNLRWRDFSRRTGVSETDLMYLSEEGVRAKVDLYTPGHLVLVRDHSIDRVKIQRYVNQTRDITGQAKTLLVFDSLQKLPFKRLQDRRHEIDAWLRVFEEVKGNDPNITILFTSELSRDGGQPKESGDIEYSCDFLLELFSDGDDSVKTKFPGAREETIEVPDNGKRFLKIKLARDVEIPAKAFQLDFDFEHWTFVER